MINVVPRRSWYLSVRGNGDGRAGLRQDFWSGKIFAYVYLSALFVGRVVCLSSSDRQASRG